MAAKGKVLGLEFEVQGEKQVRVGISRVMRSVSDLRPLWDLFRGEFTVYERAQFATQGGAGRSGRWRPLSPAYAARKRRIYGEQPILVASGRLRQSLTEGPEVFDARPRMLTIGSSVEYGAYHQAGAGRLPQRKPIDVSTVQEKVLGQAVGRLAHSLGMMWGAGGSGVERVYGFRARR